MKIEHPIILAIESSCDDTSAAVIGGGKIFSNLTAVQVDHAKYGGVIPELASRKHEEHILPVISESLEKAGCTLDDLDAIACTRGPGLMGSLLVGMSVAKSISWARRIPMITVNHMQAHVAAHYIDDPKPEFPFLCLTVSGGHTQIVLVRDYLEMEILGTTLDDAAGEAFDKIGKILGLPYPAGPHIDKLAKKGNPVFKFPITKLKPYQYSFSGLKTAVLYFLKKEMSLNPQFIDQNLEDLATSVQVAIIDNLMFQFLDVARDLGIKHLAIAGGVSANSGLRERLGIEAEKLDAKFYIPQFQYCTDNAGMIAMVAHHLYLKGEFSNLDITPLARWAF